VALQDIGGKREQTGSSNSPWKGIHEQDWGLNAVASI